MRYHRGFTLVEILITIVVIAILAAISIVAYNEIAERARDTARRTAATQIYKVTEQLLIDKQPRSMYSYRPIQPDGLCQSHTDYAREVGTIDVTEAGACNLRSMLIRGGYVDDAFWQRIPKRSGNAGASHMLVDCRHSTSAPLHKLYLGYYVKYPTDAEKQELARAVDCLRTVTRSTFAPDLLTHHSTAAIEIPLQ